ncbi:50S ribosomal protein L7/L12 [Erysipelotrichaceae bacterium Oil+RF-744-GAM-WT-6]|jgi:large subunit ribosomal protein L7/L12|uniref:Large ribosomal subunit protein bL12 n=1 Tax=Stecheria intestinalis TaxID=2606630 RepID=A0A7X2TH67_9FIRM|nr:MULTISPECIES: 50S ribosomal protein L7/L12 [Erysipelotrichaceae]MCI2153953.1 50S ribosomal protein L7/L12 [Solobacterium sp.]MDY3235046.1 50S ribosomal protein L7/L12 [Erysipelotrichaceae bacterium]MDY4682405.1 50S ribosomal protein L7/L12 [Lachnospiraceae bacterium]MCI6745798.1 50S ribosomal protein L7/L12 [Anaerolactibacter massiliensis]MDD5880475.1 50S ribosomal protein L7/L12 [Stecheria intestinalis]
MAKLTKEDILAYLDEATILELNDLVKAIEEKYGVSAAAPVAVAAAPAEAADAAPKNVTVVLTSFGDSKVGVIKVVREITGLGLIDAKKLVDGVPAELKKDVPAEEAENIKKKLTDAGATVEFK